MWSMYEFQQALNADEGEAAKQYWATRPLNRFYTADQHWAHHVADRIADFEPDRVVEFGCGAGRNLKVVRDRHPLIELVGVDINPEAVRTGQEKWGLDLRVGDESWLADQPTGSYDVLFTVSVFDHLADPQPALREAKRIASVLLLLEPWLGEEGKVIKAPGADGDIVDATPYSYSWDYEARLIAEGLAVVSYPYRLSDAGLGADYQMYEARR